MINSKCYTFELLNYSNGFLDSFVDATYIITMEGSERRKNIDLQLKTFIPTKNIHIVNNKGYKKCEKKLFENKPPYDITDAYFNTINHSLNNNYNNILILEDDFIFSHKIKDKNIINEIKLFFEKNKRSIFYYNLGPIPFIFYPNLNFFDNTYSGIYTMGAQSIIYTKKIQIDIMKYINKNIYHWDHFLVNKYKNYFYKYPLCYQIFPPTENQKYWNEYKFMHNISTKIIQIFGLDNNPEPGFSNCYTLLFIINNTLPMFLIIIILILIYYIIKSLNSKKLSKIKIKK